MPGNPIADLVGGGIGGVFNYLGAKKQASAMEDAAKLQAEGTQKALDFTKQAYGDTTARLKPYNDAGASASGFAAKLLGASPYVAAFRPQQQFQAPPAGAPATGQLVTVRAPDGSTKQFPAGDPMIALAQQKGAQIVGAPQQGGYTPDAMAARV